MSLANLSDKILLDNLKKDSHEAYDALFHRYWQKCFAIAWQKINDEQEALDIVQDLFIHLWEIRHRLPADINLPAYITRAIRNRVLNWLRNLQSNDLRKTAFLQHLQSLTAGDTLSPTIHKYELHEEWASAIDTLPERMREIYVLRYRHELSVAEISYKLNIQPQSVKNQLSNAVQRIRQILRQYHLWLPILTSLSIFY